MIHRIAWFSGTSTAPTAFPDSAHAGTSTAPAAFPDAAHACRSPALACPAGSGHSPIAAASAENTNTGFARAAFTRRTIGKLGIGAISILRIAYADVVAIVQGRARFGRSRRASARITRIVRRASIAIVARGSIGSFGIGALSILRIAHARDVTRIERRAGFRGSGHTRPGVAGIV